MEKKNKNAGKKLGISAVRHAVQVLVLALFCIPVVAAGWSLFGIRGAELSDNTVATPSSLPFFGTLTSTNIGPVTLLDPYAVLQVTCASKTFDLSWLVRLLPVLVVYALIRGRVFCGWICPVNLVLEVVDWLHAKALPKQELPEHALPRHVKVYVAAAILVLSAIVSVPVFEVLSPVSFINKGLVLGSTVGGVTLVAIIIAELAWGHRVWCRCLCPLGGFYEVIGKIGLVNVKSDHDKCIGCNKCKKACLCDPEILDKTISGEDLAVCAGDCMLCGKCVDACPTGCLKVGIGRG